MPPKGASTALKPMRLPPLPQLRLRSPNSKQENPCTTVMASVLSCWASSGYGAEGCIALEQSLRACMDNKPPQKTGKSSINYHLARLYPKIVGPTKKK